ncbi:hypothetical protein GTP44_08395 [Duganella sp. FT50W]|uniref:DNA breaking-rejoining protein n=1 Tax=Duganella lactea TaxID=2692173 RepID=A0A6L8MQ28_9BURK|nr:hypothetical protein [Duganella lactea]MYM81978.1 hypothetical protein [Duganella lactea]
MKIPLLLATLCSALVLTSAPAQAAGQLARHMTELSGTPQTKTMRGKLRGHETAEYSIRLRAGQSLAVTLKTNLRANCFNISGPGDAEALFVGSRDGNRYRAKVARDGDYKISVYLMESAARSAQRASYSLKIDIRDK